jgi:primosomal protein N' (replication factor Y)
VLCPSVTDAQRLAARLARAGHPVACVAHDRPGVAAAGEWARAAAGGVTVIGARAGAWAPVPDLGRVVVLDEHDERYQAEQAPTWHARDVACERAERAGRPCLLVSPCPTLEALEWGELVRPSRAEERRGWPPLEIVDRRHDDPTRGGLFSGRLVDLVRGEGRVVCVVNRIGRARLLACATCGALGRCEVCGASVEQLEMEVLRCRRCGTERPVVCTACGSTRFRNLRIGVTRAREELEALVGEPVGEVTGTSGGGDPGTRVVVGTEAVLHRVTSADAVAFLDIDQELTAARYRAPEQALALLALGARVVRGREEHGRLMVQTRQPDHTVLEAALHADPARVAEVEAPLREALGLPPYRALAVVSGPAAPELMERLGAPLGLRVDGPAEGAWRLVAPSHLHLCDALAAVERPAGRVRIEVDPHRV